MNNVKVKDIIDGASNFNSWKSRVLIILEENDLLKFVEGLLKLEGAEKLSWKKSDAKARRILIEFVKDNLIPQISKKKIAKGMFDTLKKLFENSNINKALALRQQLSNIKITGADTIASYFMKITKLKDQLATIGETIEDIELVVMTLNGFVGA